VTALLTGRRGLVLGVSGVNSIGYHVAQKLRELGASIAVTCRPARLASMGPLAAELCADVYSLEVTDESSFVAAFDALGRAGPLDFLVHGLIDVPEGVLAGSILDVSRDDGECVVADRRLPTCPAAAAPEYSTARRRADLGV